MSTFSKTVKAVRNLLIYRPIDGIFGALGYKIVRKDIQFKPRVKKARAADDAETFVTRRYLMTPRSKPFSFITLIAYLEVRGLTGIIKRPISGVTPKLIISSTHKDLALSVLAQFCTDEGAALRYRANSKTSTFEDFRSLINEFSKVDRASIKLLSLRSSEEISFSLEFWKEYEEYYHAPSANLISRRLWKNTVEEYGLFTEGKFSDYSQILRYQHAMAAAFPIDLVFTWVNADDPNWQALYAAHAPQTITDGNSRSRFHSRDELMYALRSWEKNAPFIRKFFVVSNCAPPSWLDLSNERLEWVPHEAILPVDALPTFSSHAIETCLHKIPGLSNHFIYSNDDNLITRTAKPTDFYFPNGIAKVRLEPYGMVNGSATKGHPDYLNGARNANRLIEQEFSRSTTQLVTHSPQPLLKEVLEEIESKYASELYQTTHNRFRNYDDVALTGYMHAHYAILSSKAVFDETPVRLIQQNHKFGKIFSDLITAKATQPSSLPLSICLNDGADSHLNETWNNSVKAFLDAFYPEKSSFERI